MNDTEIIKQYYQERIYCAGMPTFINLRPEDIKVISETFGFAKYRLSYTWNHFKQKVKTGLGLN